MDGVIADFDKRYRELYGERASGEDRVQKNFSVNWDNFVATRQFESLDWFPGGQDLVRYIQQSDIPVEILSSTGGPKYHVEVRRQKHFWLASRFGIGLRGENIVPGRRIKRFFSYPGNILIDDTEDVVEEFNQYGGKAILHRSAEETIKQLEDILNM